MDKLDPTALKQIILTPKSSVNPCTTLEDADLDEEPTVETVLEDEEKLGEDDDEHPHVQHAPVQFLSDKTGKNTPLDHEQLVNHHCLLHQHLCLEEMKLL